MAKKMLTEYAYKIHLKTIREEGRAEGRAEGREEGLAEGRAEGHAEGHAEGKAEMVLEMLKENQPLDFISRVSKYSKEKIAEIGRLHGVL